MIRIPYDSIGAWHLEFVYQFIPSLGSDWRSTRFDAPNVVYLVSRSRHRVGVVRHHAWNGNHAQHR